MRIVLGQVMLMLGLGVSAGKKAGNKPLEQRSREKVECLDDQFVPYRYGLLEYWGHLLGSAKFLLLLTRGAAVCVPAPPLL